MVEGFVEYGKVGRLGQQDTDGILHGHVFAQPKLDGTNASVWLDEDGIVQCGSRKRMLSKHKDKIGFHKHVREDQDIQRFMIDTRGRYRLYGEWLVPHTVNGYESAAWRNFYVFDVYDNMLNRFLTPDEQEQLLRDTDILTVPYQQCLDPNASWVDACRNYLSTFLMQEGEKGEGIVLKNYSFINKFGNPKHAKFLCENFSVAQGKEIQSVADVSPETALAAKIVPDDLLVKTLAKVTYKHGGWQTKYMPEFLETVWHDAVTEELYDALKKFKGNEVRVKTLKAEVFRIAREYALDAQGVCGQGGY